MAKNRLQIRCHQEALPTPQGAWVQRRSHFQLDRDELPSHLRDLLPLPEKLGDGRLKVWGFVGRGECIYQYYGDEGQPVRIYRPGAVVFDPGNLATLVGCPMTLGHPKTAEGGDDFVRPETWREYCQGSVLEDVRAYPEFGLVAAPMTLAGREILAAYEGGMRALSTGEWCDEAYAPNTVDGQPYDTVLVAHRYNHLALVPAGAAGPLAQIRVHQLPYQIQTNQGGQRPEGADEMEYVKITVMGVDFFVPKGQEEAHRQRIHSMLIERRHMDGGGEGEGGGEDELKKLRDENAALKAEQARLQAQVDELRAQAAAKANEGGEGGGEEVEKVVAERVNARLQLHAKVAPLLGHATTVKRANAAGQEVEVPLVKLSDVELMTEAIVAARPNSRAELAGKERAYLEARVDMMLEHRAASDKADQALGGASTRAHNHSAPEGRQDPERVKARQAQAALFGGGRAV